MASERVQFGLFSRLLHWTMAAMVLAMLGIGVAMVASLADYHVLVSIHRPLGVAIFVLVVIRFANRLLTRRPSFPATMSRTEQLATTAAEYTMYGLMFVLPLVGWGMLSAAGYPIVLFGRTHLPPILPRSAALYELLRTSHTLFAYVFFLTFLAHLSSVLFHALVIRDGILRRMTWSFAPPGDAVADARPSSEHEAPL